MAGWGLGYDDVAAGNDALVYCSISGYGQTGPDRDRPGFDAAVAAHLGIMNEWGGSRDGPIFLGHPALDYSTAMLAVIGTLACLRSRAAHRPRRPRRRVAARRRAGPLPDELVDRGPPDGDRPEEPVGRPPLRLQAAAAAHVRVRRRPADPGPHRRRRGLRPGDGGLRARRRGLEDAGRGADVEPADRPRPGDHGGAPPRDPAQPPERGVAAAAVGAPGRRAAGRRARRGPRRRPGALRRHRRRARRSRARPHRGRRSRRAAVGDTWRDRLAGADVRRARRRDPPRRMAGRGAADPGRHVHRGARRSAAGRAAPRRLRDVLRLALRRPAAVGPRRRGDQGRGDRRRPDATAAGDVRGRQPRQVRHVRQPQAPAGARDHRGAGEGRRRRPAQPPPRRGRAARHRLGRPAAHRARPDLPLLPRLRLERAEVDAAELRPAAVGLRRAVRHRRRRRQPAPRHVRQRGLLQRAPGGLRLPPGGRPPRAHGRGPGRREPAAALVGVHDLGVLQGRRRVPLGHPPRRRRAVRVVDGLPPLPVPGRLVVRDVHRGRAGRRAGSRRAPARRARRARCPRTSAPTCPRPAG